jgi:hypothetical protein
LPSHSLLRVPTLEQSQLAQTLHDRFTSKPGKSFPLSSSASFAEDFSISADRMNYKKHQDLGSAIASESIHDISSDSRTSLLLCTERKLSAPSVTDTECEKSANASNQEESLQRKSVNCCKCGQVSRVITEGFCASPRVSSQSLNSCHRCEDLVYITDRQEYCNLHTIDEISMTNTQETTFNSQNGHTALPHDSQLQENDGVSRADIMTKIVTLIVIKYEHKVNHEILF